MQVLHPKNPFAPTLHFNYRYFETDAPKGNFLKFIFLKLIIFSFAYAVYGCICLFSEHTQELFGCACWFVYMGSNFRNKIAYTASSVIWGTNTYMLNERGAVVSFEKCIFQ